MRSSLVNFGLGRREIAELLEVCDGDIRACFNYLQFLSRKLDSDLHSFGPKTSGDFATKDALVSWFSLVDQIFKAEHVPVSLLQEILVKFPRDAYHTEPERILHTRKAR